MRPLDIFAHIHQKPRNMRIYPDSVDNIPKTLHIFLKYVGDKQTPVSSTEPLGIDMYELIVRARCEQAYASRVPQVSARNTTPMRNFCAR